MARPTVLVASHALRHRSGRARGRLGTGPGSLLDVSRPLLARPGRPEIALGPALARPGRVRNASRRAPGTVVDAQNQPRPIFHPFFIDFGSVFRRFPPVFSSIFDCSCCFFGCEGYCCCLFVFARAFRLSVRLCVALPELAKRTQPDTCRFDLQNAND